MRGAGHMGRRLGKAVGLRGLARAAAVGAVATSAAMLIEHPAGAQVCGPSNVGCVSIGESDAGDPPGVSTATVAVLVHDPFGTTSDVSVGQSYTYGTPLTAIGVGVGPAGSGAVVYQTSFYEHPRYEETVVGVGSPVTGPVWAGQFDGTDGSCAYFVALPTGWTYAPCVVGGVPQVPLILLELPL